MYKNEVVNLIYGITKMRYKQGKDDPAQGLSISCIRKVLNHRLKNTWIRNASRDPLNCQL